MVNIETAPMNGDRNESKNIVGIEMPKAIRTFAFWKLKIFSSFRRKYIATVNNIVDGMTIINSKPVGTII